MNGLPVLCASESGVYLSVVILVILEISVVCSWSVDGPTGDTVTYASVWFDGPSVSLSWVLLSLSWVFISGSWVLQSGSKVLLSF